MLVLSLSVLQRRARDVTKLLLPFEPDPLLADLAAGLTGSSESLIRQMHLFPLGGIAASAEYLTTRTGTGTRKAAAGRRRN